LKYVIRKSIHRLEILAGAETVFDEAPDQTGGKLRYCTDCHGIDHRMQVRTVRWNKATGELIRAEN